MNANSSHSETGKPGGPSSDNGEGYAPRKRASDRVFRRSRAARARRAQADKSDFRFISLILQLCVLMALGLVALGVMAQKQMSEAAQTSMSVGAQPSIDLSSLQSIATPWLGPLSKLEAGGIALIILFSAFLLWRWRR